METRELDMVKERFSLAEERITELQKELDTSESSNKKTKKAIDDFFKCQTNFAMLLIKTYHQIQTGYLENAEITQLAAQNKELYADILPEHYQVSYTNPSYAAEQLKEYGQILCVLAAEMRAMIPACFEQNMEFVLIRLELLLEVYGCFQTAGEEQLEGPDVKQLQEICYWYYSDYAQEAVDRRIGEQVDPSFDFAAKIIQESDISNNRYLYRYGEYVSENELAMADYLREVPEEKITIIADTFTEGYRIGFVLGQKDLGKKKTVNIRYCLGFERIIRKAIANFDKMGLKPTIFRTPVSLLENKGLRKMGYYGGIANKQFDYDHRDDIGLFLDKKYVQRKLEIMKTVFEARKDWAVLHAGPACLDVFGEPDFAPVNKKEAVSLNDKQQKLSVEYLSGAGRITNDYIKGEERSFTIIAFPVPSIALDAETGKVDRARFEEIFNEIIRINTLDYAVYRDIQQKIIDVLDEGEYVLVKGMNGNQTNMKVCLHKLTDPQHQTNFENCVADVNIPVGEVFTSPILTGTEGTLHVSSVFLQELKYENLKLEFKDGMITGCSCTNFESREENDKLLRDTVLCHHDSLPIGEFAIGTNTTAYVAANKLAIADKLPILIAEKMGPHFAVGDTCYSHTEDHAVYNPDGKEIIARGNEVTDIRKEHPEKAYFNCHTDITIPYDELGELSIVKKDGSVVIIIEEGRFILPGTEELNKPFEERQE